MGYRTVVRDIKDLKIQGAESIAVASVKSIQGLVRKGEGLSKLKQLKEDLLKTRPTEPCMRNSLNYVFQDINFKKKQKNHSLLKKEINQRIDYVLSHFKESKSKIARIGAKKIKKGAVVFTHCHSSTVMGILKEAKRHIDFEVRNTETRPLYQGRMAAKELLKAKIPVTMYVDAGARVALKGSDLMLIGCDAITAEGKVINKIGSEMFAEIAHSRQIPVYVCTNSWKFDTMTLLGYEERIEKRSKDEIWRNAPKGLKIENYSFEKISPHLITGIISELGILTPTKFVEEAKARGV